MRCSWWSVSILWAGAVVAVAACGRRAETSSYKDALPPPEDPMVMDGEPGRYGGRFVVVGLGPRTRSIP